MGDVDDSEEPPLRESLSIRIEIYDTFSLAFWEQMPGTCGSGETPAEAITDMLEVIAHNYENVLPTPDEQCTQDLIAAKPAIRKFFEGLPLPAKETPS